jgi:hypothetical protein
MKQVIIALDQLLNIVPLTRQKFISEFLLKKYERNHEFRRDTLHCPLQFNIADYAAETAALFRYLANGTLWGSGLWMLTGLIMMLSGFDPDLILNTL